LQPGHLVEVGRDEVAELPQDASALGGGHLGPGALAEGPAGGLNRRIDVALVALGDPRALFFGRGGDGGVRLAGGGRPPLATDEDLIEGRGSHRVSFVGPFVVFSGQSPERSASSRAASASPVTRCSKPAKRASCVWPRA